MERNVPIRIGWNYIRVYDSPYTRSYSEYEIPSWLKRVYNKMAYSNNTVYLNGYRLNQSTGTWTRSFKGTILNWLL
jgi:hypothetical protein